MPERPSTDSRRRFLGTLALAPLVPLAAACTTTRSAAGASPAAQAAAGAAASETAPADPYRVLREQALTGDPEPALSFRVLAARGARR